MTMQINIKQIQKLETFRVLNMDRFHYPYPWELAGPYTADSLKQSYSSLIDKVLGTSQYMFITVNLSTSQIRRALDARKKKAGGVLPDNCLRLGQEYWEARRSGVGAVDAMEALWFKFFERLNLKVLGTHRAKRRGEYLRWIRVYENNGKRYRRSPPTHLHMLLEVPDKYSHLEFAEIFRKLFGWLVYSSSARTRKNKVLDFQIGRSDGESPHPVYVQKQLIDWDTASDRMFESGIPAKSRSVIAY
jgi:hypothetical protein